MNRKLLLTTLVIFATLCVAANAVGDEFISVYQPTYTMNAGNEAVVYRQPTQVYYRNDVGIVAAYNNEATYTPSWGEDDDSDVILHFDPRHAPINCITDPMSCRDFEAPDDSGDDPRDLGIVDNADRTIDRTTPTATTETPEPATIEADTDTDETPAGSATHFDGTDNDETAESSPDCIGAAAPCEEEEDNADVTHDPYVSYADIPGSPAGAGDWTAYQGTGGCSVAQNAQANTGTLLSVLIFAVSSLTIIVRRKVDSV